MRTRCSCSAATPSPAPLRRRVPLARTPGRCRASCSSACGRRAEAPIARRSAMPLRRCVDEPGNLLATRRRQRAAPSSSDALRPIAEPPTTWAWRWSTSALGRRAGRVPGRGRVRSAARRCALEQRAGAAARGSIRRGLSRIRMALPRRDRAARLRAAGGTAAARRPDDPRVGRARLRRHAAVPALRARAGSTRRPCGAGGDGRPAGTGVALEAWRRSFAEPTPAFDTHVALMSLPHLLGLAPAPPARRTCAREALRSRLVAPSVACGRRPRLRELASASSGPAPRCATAANACPAACAPCSTSGARASRCRKARAHDLAARRCRRLRRSRRAIANFDDTAALIAQPRHRRRPATPPSPLWPARSASPRS